MMKTRLLPLFFAALSLFFFRTSRADSELAGLECRKSAAFLAPADSAGGRKYAPDREIQMLHLALDVTPDFDTRSISAQARLRLKAVNSPMREVRLDAVDLRIRNVSATRPVEGWQVTEDKLIVTFREPVPAEKEATLTIDYAAEPTQGLYFRTKEMGYPEGDDHLFTQGEAIEARHWYPCLDSPNQQFTSEITCRVPQGMTAVSNGRLISETKDPATGLLVIHWSQEKRHANYLISLVAGYFKKLDDNCHGIPLAFYTPPSEIQYARTSFNHTRDMIEFFEKEIGVPYPWTKYDQVCVHDFVAGGMENTSATTLTDQTLFTEDTENIFESDGLVSHELAHQWFGDLVTCKDWSHLWLNEGFATFYESLWNEQLHGRDNMLYELYHRAREITGTPDNKAIVRRTYEQPGEMFDYLAYPKGSWVLHMLRCQLGPELYRKCIRTYVERHVHGNVTTDDLRAVIEELSGRSFDQFFDQWLYHGRQPELAIAYSWDEPSKLAKISVQQTQEINANVLLFGFPLPVRFEGKSGTVDRTIQVSKKQEDFYFALPGAPDSVRIDPDYTLLAKITFNIPGPMLDVQLANQKDVMGRLLGVERLGTRSDNDAIAKLKKLLQKDPFYGVRLEAANALRSIHTDEALTALLECTEQADARVRRQVTDNIGSYYSQKSCDFGLRITREEKNPEIVCTALRDLGGYSRPELAALLIKSLNSDSFRNRVADSAIGAMRAQDDPAFVAPLIETLGRAETNFTSGGFAQGLRAVAFLARNEEKKDLVREFLMRHLESRNRTVQVAAIGALGTLSDPKAIAPLQKFTSAVKDSPQRSAAEQAVASLRAARKPVDDFKNLREEVLQLQKTSRELKDQIEDLKKRLQAVPAQPTPLPAKASKPVRPNPSPKAGGL